jgi:hypothetical protein
MNGYKYIPNLITGNTFHSTKQMMTGGRILCGTIYQLTHISEKVAKHLMEQVIFGQLQTKMNISTQTW